MHAVAPPAPAAAEAHQSGIPGAPWHRDDSKERRVFDVEGHNVLTAQLDSRYEPIAAIDAARRVAMAATILPDLAASAAKLVAAYEAWMATVEGSAEERAALDAWDELAGVEIGVIGGLLKAAGIPLPDGTAPAEEPLAPEDEAAFRPGGTA